jgi:hypothetical protein
MMFQKAQYWPRMLERIPPEAREHLPRSARSGTGEVRAWISVAVAMQRAATVVDYVPAHCTQTGCGFVCWPPAEGDTAG